MIMEGFHRKEPVRKFDVNQSMYDLVKGINSENMDSMATSYFLQNKTFGQVINETDRLASAFKSVGVNDDDKVGVCLLTVPESATTLLALNKINAVSYWMDATIGKEDLVKYINNDKIKTLVIMDIKPLMNGLKEVINRTCLEHVVVVSPFEFLLGHNPLRKKIKDNRFVYYTDFLNNKSNDIVTTKYDQERPSIIIQSSGSTGVSKSIVHTDYNFNSAIEKMAYLDLPFEFGRKSFVCAPPWVVYGLVNSIYSGFVFGHQTIFSLAPKENMLYKNLGKYDIAYGVPSFLRYLYNKIEELSSSHNPIDKVKLEKIKRELDAVKVFISGGDKITADEVIRWQNAFNTPIINGYGNNEVVGAAIVSPLLANKPGSIGVPMRGNIVKTYDEVTNAILPDGERGEILIHTPNMFKEYLHNPEATAENKSTIDGKEWVRTGDLGYIDSDGYVFLNGRNKRLIIDGTGYKISPENAENVIQKLEYVNKCVVVGAKLSEHNTVPMAIIELKDEYKNNSEVLSIIENECDQHMKEYERPKIFFEIEKIPIKPNGGKVDYLELDKIAEEYVQNMGADKLVLK